MSYKPRMIRLPQSQAIAGRNNQTMTSGTLKQPDR